MALTKTATRSSRSNAAKPRRGTGRRGRPAVALVALMLSALVAGVAQQQSSNVGNAPQAQVEQGTRGAAVRPKRQTTRQQSETQSKSAKDAAKGDAHAKSSDPVAAAASADNLAPILAAADFDLVGLAVTASPSTQTVPKNTPTAVLATLQVPEGTDPAQIVAGLNPNLRVRGELTGPSLARPFTVEAPLGQPIPIPPLSQAGDHVLQNLRVVDTGVAGEPIVAAVTPDSCGIVVIDRILISEVHVNELSYEQIRQAGIILSDDSYRAFNFTLGLATTSNAQTISIPVAFPNVGVTDPRPVVGQPTISAPGVDVPTVLPVMLETVGDGGDGGSNSAPPQFGEAPVRIPGVIVFPGRVGFLHQFFEAIVIVANGAPNGAPLVLRGLHAKAKLPDAGTPGIESDDPLRIAETQTGGRVTELDLHGLGEDGKYGTPDDTLSFGPGQSGQGTFLLEGLKEGLHTVNFDLEAMLEGLPSGPVKVKGEVPGAVLVRDASFAVTFTHPAIVRAGQTYDLGMTLFNSGASTIRGAFAKLSPNSISGAELLGQDDGRREFDTDIATTTSSTVKWRLRSNTTGEVTATYVKVGDGVSAGLTLVTGVGDRNVPLSPESLILPDPVRHLPPDVVEAGRALLGQGWSIANAPGGSLPHGVAPMTKQGVIDRAVELGLAGMRVDFGEPVTVSLDTLARDWLGELKSDSGFADATRNTPAGFEWYDRLGAEFYKHLASGPNQLTPGQLQQEFADAESPRSPFISVLATQAEGGALFGARLTSPGNQHVGFGASLDDRAGDLQAGGSLRLDAINPLNGESTSTLGQMLVVSNPDPNNWTLELTGWRDGAADLSLIYPATSRTYRQLTWSGAQIVQGRKYRVFFKPLSTTTTPALEELRDGAWQPTGLTPTIGTLSQPAPKVVGVIQVTPDVVAGGDKYGRLVGVLFSKPMSRTEAETIGRYRIGGGALHNSNPSEQVGGPVKVLGAHLDYGDRFAFLGLDTTIGPYIDRDLTVSGLVDSRRMSLSPSPTTTRIEPRVSPEGHPPGAYLTGRVLNADGTPVPNAPVIYWVQECDDGVQLFPPPPVPIALRYTDAQGRYSIDYVRDGDCAPLYVSVNNPTTHSEKRLSSPVAYDGQHMIFDIVFLARGNVGGTVTSGGRGVAKVQVRIVPDLDAIGTKVVETDDTGHYLAKDIPVGNLSVTAVGTGDFRTSSGLAAGTITGPGLTATVNVSLQDISGVVGGRVIHPDGTPSPGQLVVAYARIPGFSSTRIDGAIAVGFDFADREGNFRIANLPIGSVSLEVRDYVTGMYIAQAVQLTATQHELSGVLITLSGLGGISGHVTNEVGAPVAGAFVNCAGSGTRADANGDYTLQGIPAGNNTVIATDATTGLAGSALAPVRLGETTNNINITILRPAKLQGHVYLLEEGSTTPKPVKDAFVTANGFDVTTTDAQGAYTLNNVAPNSELTLRFVEASKGLVVNTPVILQSGETLVRDATFRPGSIHGHVYQPDGVTTAVAPVTAFVPLPILTQGGEFGMIDTESTPLSVQSGTDGLYQLHGINPGRFRVSTSSPFFPTRVTGGADLAPHGEAEVNLTMVSTLAGKIQGRVFEPDGTTPVAAGVRVTLGGGALADATVRTDENGHYEFGEVFSAGGYQLTANDILTGNANRINVSVEKNKDGFFDIRLLGKGGLRVHVIDGAGNPATGGSVTLDGSAYPNNHRFAQLTPTDGGVVEFDNLAEGPYGISATQRGLGGRASANVPIGSTVEVTIQLQASGTVKGKVFMPGGTTPIGLADVELHLNGRSVGFNVTSDTDEDRGSFIFLNVPVGDFTLDVFDNRTGRVGRSAGKLSAQDETATVNVELLPVGTVTGRVTANGQPVDHALVQMSADGSGLRGAYGRATTDPDGRFRFTGIPVGRFTVSVSDAPGGQTGYTTGTVMGTVEPLADTIADVALEPSQTVTGTVYKAGGGVAVPGAQVSVTVAGRNFNSATNESGVYRLSFVPLGEVRVRAEAPTGYDRGESAPVTGSVAAGTVTADVTLAGTGDVQGTALDSNGSPLQSGTVAYTNDAWGTPVLIIAAVQTDGHFDFKGAPVGPFSLKLTVANRVGVGSASGQINANQTTNVTIKLEDAGRIIGRLKSEDGSAPVVGADVILTLYRANGPGLRFYAHTDSQGAWAFDNIPLGGVVVNINDVAGGHARARGVALTTNGQVLDLGEMQVDSTPIGVASVAPADGATGVTNFSPALNVTFTEPAEADSVNSGTVYLSQGGSRFSVNIALSPDGRIATVTPTGRLTDTSAYTLTVNTSVEDRAGNRLARDFSSSFTTADQTPPSVVSITPADSVTDAPVETLAVVTFNEALAPAQDLRGVVRLLSGTPSSPVAGTVSLDATGKVATFTPSQPLAESTRYTVSVTGQSDAAGNAQASLVNSNFSSFNPAPTVSVTSPAEGQQVAENQHITITADASDNTSVSNVSFTAGGVNLGADTNAPYSVSYTVPAGTTSLTVTATATDDLGKTSTATRTVEIVPDLGGTVAGTVFDPANHPVALASVTVTAANGVFTATTGADGRYQFDQVGIGGFNVTATDPASAFRGRASGTINSFTDNVGLDIHLAASGTVTGTIFRSDTTTPFAGAQVSVYTQSFSSLVGTATADAQGHYTVDNVPLGNFIVDVSDAATGDRGRQTNQLNANGATATVNVVMNGTGRVVVTVRRLSNSVVSGAQVSLTGQMQFGGTQNLTTQTDGTATFEHVLAGGFSVSAIETTTNLRGSVGGSVSSGATSNITVQLQPAGTITGHVLDVDGTTPRSGLTVRLINNYYYSYVVQQTTSGADGGFTFDAVPLDTYYLDVLETQDGVERARARVGGVTLSTNGQTLTRDLTLIGIGTVTGHVRDESGTTVPNAEISLRSSNEAVGGFFSARTDAEGLYTIANVPLGRFNATATDPSRPLRGEANGQVTQNAQTVTADITVFNNSVNLPQYFYDASDFYYDLQGDGSIANGSSGAYTGEYWTGNQRGFLLDIIAGGSANRFTGGTLGTREGDGREIALRQNLAGLDVTRKVYTPRDGYFTRYVEMLSNPTSNPITVDVRVLSNIRYSYYGGATDLVATSSGDNTLNVADQSNPDRWAVVDDPDDHDPFLYYYSLPALGFAFDGANAAEHAAQVGFTNPSGAQLSYQWSNVTVPPGGTVAYLHFGVQQTSRAGARASVERLVQLPPEALAGLDATELSAVRNFAIPTGGASAVAPLPSLGGSFSGRTLAGDGTTAVPYTSVEFKSKNPLFGRTHWAYADANGAFGLAANINDYGSSVVIPVDDFTLVGHHPYTGILSPTASGSFAAGQTAATQDVVFTGTGIISGVVRRHTGQAVQFGGSIYVSRPGFGANFGVNSDGSFSLTGLAPANDYTLSANIGHPQGSNNTGTATASVVAGQVTAQDVILSPTGTVTGNVRDAVGNPAASVYVRLYDPNCYWCSYRQTYTDGAGNYTLTDVPTGTYLIQAYEPYTGIPASANMTLAQDQTLTQNFQLIGLGTVQAQVNFASGAPAPYTYVYIQEEARGSSFNWGGYTDGAGHVTIQYVPVGNFTVRGFNPYNGNLYADTAGRINANGDTTSVTVTLPGSGVVTGRVTYADGAPVSSSFVEIVFADNSYYNYTFTDSNGYYTFNQIKVGSPFTVRAYNPSNGNIRRESPGNVIAADGDTLTVNLAMPGQATVHVAVLNADGTPYTSGGYVFISDSLRTYLHYAGNVDSSGTLDIPNVPEGDFSLLVQEQGSGRFLGSASGTIRQADNGHTVNANVSVSPKGTIRGTLYAADGQTVYNASYVLLEVFDKASGNYFGYTYAYNGNYEFTNLRVGTQGFIVRVFSPRDGSVIGEKEGKFDTDGEVRTIDFTLPFSIVRGTVTFFDGTPVPYPNVYIFQQDGYLRTYYPVSVDEQGHYAFIGVPAGPFTLTAQDGSSGLTAHVSGTIADAAVPVTLDVSLPATGTFNGTITKKDAGGNLVAVPNARVKLDLEGENFERYTYADDEGHYAFDHVAVGSYILRAEDGNNNAGLSGMATGTLANGGDTTTVNITLPDSGTVTGTVFREDGTTPVGYASLVISAPGLDYERYADADANGVYSFSGIPIGAFSLQAVDYNGNITTYGEASGSLAAAGGTTTVNITLLRTATVSGKVFRSNGSPASNYTLRLEGYGGAGNNGNFRQYVNTDASGSFSVAGVPVGLVRAEVYYYSEAGFASAMLTPSGLTDFNITLGGAAFGGLVNLDGADGFRYQIWTGGDLNYGGLTDGTGRAYDGSSYLSLNGDDYPNYPRVAVLSQDGREVTSGPVGIDSLVYTRKIFSPLTGGFVRYLEVFTNPTASDITVSAKIEHYTWARNDARVVFPPSANGNHYAVLDSTLGQSLSTAFVMGGPGARSPVRVARFISGNDYQYFNWQMTVPAGQTRILMHYTLERGATDTAGARTQAEALTGLTDPHALDQMTETEKSQVLTFEVPNTASTQPANGKQSKTQAKAVPSNGGAAASSAREASSVKAVPDTPTARGGPGAGGGRSNVSEMTNDKRRAKDDKSRAARAADDKSKAAGDKSRTKEEKSRQTAAGAGGR
ncbi:MAG: large repetitive protein [Acidobacteriota bacterium]|nr:large repetitive protein [Acidobacteriota bacterium]